MREHRFEEDQKIREFYKETKMPEEVKKRMEETLQSLEPETAARPRKKRITFRRAIAIAAAASLCVGTAVFAAGKIYGIYLEKEKPYQARISLEVGETLPEEVPEVEVRVNYLPEGFAQDPDKGVEYYYTNPDAEDTGYYVSQPLIIDQADPLTVSFVKDSEALEVNGHDAVYVNGANGTDSDWNTGTVYVVFEEVDRILPINMWGYADKEELLKIAENTELISTGNMVASAELPRWSEEVSREEVEEIGQDVTAAEADKDAMKNLHQIGEPFEVASVSEKDAKELTLEACVTEVQVLDDLSVLAAEEQIPDSWKELVGSDKKLVPDTLDYVKWGDGEDTLNEIVSTQESPVKLVYAAVEYTNTQNTAVNDAWFFGGLLCLDEEDGTFHIYERTDEDGNKAQNETACVGAQYWEMAYYDVTGGTQNNNYIPEIAPGETVTVHMAWIVNEDELDKLYLDLTGSGALTEAALETGLVKLES